MPSRSKVVTMLPAHIRAEIERRMLEKGFSDYRALTEWVRQQGYQISDDSLWRYGRAFQQQLADSELAVRQARALTEVALDPPGGLNHALTHVFEQKIFSALIEAEHPKYGDLARLAHAVADLCRATVWRQRYADAVRLRDEQHKPSQRAGLTEEAYIAIRSALLGRPYDEAKKAFDAVSPKPESD